MNCNGGQQGIYLRIVGSHSFVFEEECTDVVAAGALDREVTIFDHHLEW